MIELNGICKCYKSGDGKIDALQDISLSVENGDFLAVTGESGSGKSTLLSVIGLLESFDGGSYLLDKTDVKSLSEREKARLRNEKFGFIFQSFFLDGDYKVWENAAVPLYIAGEREKTAKAAAIEMLARVGLSERAEEKTRNLSGGERQRAAIARALIRNPEIILADEPTGSLDKANSEAVSKILKQLNDEGKTVILVTHNPLAASEAKRVIELSYGALKSDALKN